MAMCETDCRPPNQHIEKVNLKVQEIENRVNALEEELRSDALHSDGSVIGVGVITHGRHFFFCAREFHSDENRPTVRLAAC